MANLQTIPSANIDTIAVFDSNFTQVFQSARPMRDEVKPRAKIMDHPLETGQIISDYKITLPTEIAIILFIPSDVYRDTYQEIWNLWQQSETLTVQTRVASYGNMIISEQPHEEKSDIYDAIIMTIRFRQVLTPSQSAPFVPADPTQADTQAVGQQSSQIVTVVPGQNTSTFANNGQISTPQYVISGVQGTSNIQMIGAEIR